MGGPAAGAAAGGGEVGGIGALPSVERWLPVDRAEYDDDLSKEESPLGTRTDAEGGRIDEGGGGLLGCAGRVPAAGGGGAAALEEGIGSEGEDGGGPSGGPLGGTAFKGTAADSSLGRPGGGGRRVDCGGSLGGDAGPRGGGGRCGGALFGLEDEGGGSPEEEEDGEGTVDAFLGGPQSTSSAPKDESRFRTTMGVGPGVYGCGGCGVGADGGGGFVGPDIPVGGGADLGRTGTSTFAVTSGKMSLVRR